MRNNLTIIPVTLYTQEQTETGFKYYKKHFPDYNDPSVYTKEEITDLEIIKTLFTEREDVICG